MAYVVPRSNSRFSTFLRPGGKRTYISTTSRIASGDELKRRNGLGGSALDFRLIRHRYQPPPRLPRWFDSALPTKKTVDGALYARFAADAERLRQGLDLTDLSELDALFKYSYQRGDGEE